MSNDNQGAWWDTGYEAAEKASEAEGGDRFYLKSGAEALVLFLDGDPDDKERFGRPYGAPFLIWEYQIPTKSEDDEKVNWRNWVTSCRGRRDKEGKPMRDFVRELAPDMKPYYVGFYTIVVLEDVDYTKLLKKGDPIVDPRKILLPAKRKQLQVLKRHSDKREGLRGCVYQVFRSDDKSASTGDDWQFQERLSEEDLAKLMPDGHDRPFLYHEVLAPPPEEEIAGLLRVRAKVRAYGDRDDDKRDSRRGGGRSRRDRDDDSDRDDRDEDRSEERPSRSERSEERPARKPASARKASAEDSEGDLPF